MDVCYLPTMFVHLKVTRRPQSWQLGVNCSTH